MHVSRNVIPWSLIFQGETLYSSIRIPALSVLRAFVALVARDGVLDHNASTGRQSARIVQNTTLNTKIVALLGFHFLGEKASSACTQPSTDKEFTVVSGKRGHE
jgi:hypothetical protein